MVKFVVLNYTTCANLLVKLLVSNQKEFNLSKSFKGFQNYKNTLKPLRSLPERLFHFVFFSNPAFGLNRKHFDGCGVCIG